MNNYVTETELKGFIPELTKYLWTSETDFSKQKTQAEQTVIRDLANRGYKVRELQPKLIFDITGVDYIEDNINALRFVCTADSAGSIELLGSNDDVTYETVTTLTFTGAGTQSYMISTPYRYYVVDTTESGYISFLCEITYDGLFAYKWLELILMDSFTERNDQYYERMLYFQNQYEKLLNTMILSVDIDGDGESDSQTSFNSVNVTR